MKIIITNIPLKKEIKAFAYKYDGNSNKTKKEVIFPINEILQDALKKDDKVKVIMLEKDDVEGNSVINSAYFQKELNDINREIGADITYVPITTPFIETKDIHENLFRKIVGNIDNNSEVYADITYGPKSLPIIVFTALNFVEKYFNADIKSIVYGKVDYVDDGSNTGKTKPINPCLYDMTSLYYLNAITNAVDYRNSEEALKALDTLLNINK